MNPKDCINRLLSRESPFELFPSQRLSIYSILSVFIESRVALILSLTWSVKNFVSSCFWVSKLGANSRFHWSNFKLPRLLCSVNWVFLESGIRFELRHFVFMTRVTSASNLLTANFVGWSGSFAIKKFYGVKGSHIYVANIKKES